MYQSPHPHKIILFIYQRLKLGPLLAKQVNMKAAKIFGTRQAAKRNRHNAYWLPLK